MAGAVLQVGVPRAEPIQDGGMEVPASMGMATAMNFQTAGDGSPRRETSSSIADEVNPVLRELRAHGLQVTALHSHMLRESPRLFFMHFWGVGTPEKIGEGLKAALSKVATRWNRDGERSTSKTADLCPGGSRDRLAPSIRRRRRSLVAAGNCSSRPGFSRAEAQRP